RIDLRRDRKRTTWARSRGGFRVGGQLGDRVHCQGRSIVARVEDRFGDLNVEQVATARFGNRVAGGSQIFRCTAARSALLRIAAVVLDQQIRWFQQQKMRRGRKRRQ